MEADKPSDRIPRKRPRERHSCPRCSVNLSKSSFYEHVSECCIDEGSKMSKSQEDNADFSDSSFELETDELFQFQDLGKLQG